ncbi:hypothetical protein ACTXOJ_11385 [Glutamicibacter arilaitensis]|uniref:hypothetical protein n=1 Tax=Glutamicibacter arilaitensis TaxID=256701 RepID=UPI003FD6B7A4
MTITAKELSGLHIGEVVNISESSYSITGELHDLHHCKRGKGDDTTSETVRLKVSSFHLVIHRDTPVTIQEGQ